MYVQGVDNVYELDFNGAGASYGDVFLEAERQFSAFNFERADTAMLRGWFTDAEKQCLRLLGEDGGMRCPWPPMIGC